uniref:Uncharacterized protein n=1 Tax=Odontella aurita TaxID=265563 RepID=A0A7S4MMB2_9STRA|mmetsp:Transcript_26069/g.77181  ORF Transcript_26069/g.77181 Transcript_26069/m.77181 type:complete len:176 (+) Transcript_26069:229-756(+)|eukprot:CAMPEP_0113557598 /NCGR_PEP_ID=MMETSP0015_2-20120614/17878_1 /TAXON_ID=2838 /ORGANISM="Odontella" /LENGTH=175 /DNA_ID=CAMNT_0000459037 /DNA_START=174 /DNA_END=701 /DNA_ORIENTATION=+ /assembly_acc=CAM_ASM_000160
MGCTSSRTTHGAVETQKPKKKLGGQYPGNRRAKQQPYIPDASEFQKVNGNTEVASAHFVAYGGGNALKLMDKPNRAQPAANTNSDYVEVTLPDGVFAGDVIHVRAPDGRLNEIIVPDGMGPGSAFTVEFDPGEDAFAAEPEIAVAVPEPHMSSGPYSHSYPSPPAYPSANTGAIR